MPLIVAIGGLLVSALFGASLVLDKIDDIQEPKQASIINVGSLTMMVIGGVAVWYVLKKK